MRTCEAMSAVEHAASCGSCHDLMIHRLFWGLPPRVAGRAAQDGWRRGHGGARRRPMTRFAIPDGGRPRTAQEVSDPTDARPCATSARVAATDRNAQHELGESKPPDRQTAKSERIFVGLGARQSRISEPVNSDLRFNLRSRLASLALWRFSLLYWSRAATGRITAWPLRPPSGIPPSGIAGRVARRVGRPPSRIAKCVVESRRRPLMATPRPPQGRARSSLARLENADQAPASFMSRSTRGDPMSLSATQDQARFAQRAERELTRRL